MVLRRMICFEFVCSASGGSCKTSLEAVGIKSYFQGGTNWFCSLLDMWIEIEEKLEG